MRYSSLIPAIAIEGAVMFLGGANGGLRIGERGEGAGTGMGRCCEIREGVG
ncbi:hypothetical protein GCM10010320_15650 [Streptomyces caelestis]|nr:hypothetical protein GCM10010320_15650 [Streptomyces caelestis]